MSKKTQGLSEQVIQNAKPKEKDYKIHDRDGLCVVIRKTGRKVWHYNYQYGNKRRTLTIGHYIKKDIPGHIGLKDARMARYEARQLLDQCTDPSQHSRLCFYWPLCFLKRL